MMLLLSVVVLSVSIIGFLAYGVTLYTCATVPAILLALPRATLETFIGNMQGDGFVGYANFSLA